MVVHLVIIYTPTVAPLIERNFLQAEINVAPLIFKRYAVLIHSQFFFKV